MAAGNTPLRKGARSEVREAVVDSSSSASARATNQAQPTSKAAVLVPSVSSRPDYRAHPDFKAMALSHPGSPSSGTAPPRHGTSASLAAAMPYRSSHSATASELPSTHRPYSSARPGHPRLRVERFLSGSPGRNPLGLYDDERERASSPAEGGAMSVLLRTSSATLGDGGGDGPSSDTGGGGGGGASGQAGPPVLHCVHRIALAKAVLAEARRQPLSASSSTGSSPNIEAT